jgi:hypothetical protein
MVENADTHKNRHKNSNAARSYREHTAFTAKAKQVSAIWLLAKFSDAMSQPGNLSAGGILVNDAFLGRPHDDGFGIFERRLGTRTIAGRNRFLDLDHGCTQARAAGLVNDRAPRNLTGRLAG